MPTADIIQIISSGGALGLVLLLLNGFRAYLNDVTAKQDKDRDTYFDRIDKLVSGHIAQTDRIINDFRGDIQRISTETTAALSEMTKELQTLSGKISGIKAKASE